MSERKKPKQVVFNFKDRFAVPVQSGQKTSTIRLFLKTAPPVKGDRLKLFTGMRTKKCRKLKEVICQACYPISISGEAIILGKRLLNRYERDSLALHDGFNDAAQLLAFFQTTYGFPMPGNPHWVSWQ